MHAITRSVLVTCAALALVSADAQAYRLFQPAPAGAGDYIIGSTSTAPAPFVHWDVRELPNAKLPWTYGTAGTPDIDGNGTAGQPADIAAASGAFLAAFNAWEGVSPSILYFTQSANVAAGGGIVIDGQNLMSFTSAAQDDRQCVAVGTLAPAPGGVAANRPFAPVVAPGADFLLTTQAQVDDVIQPCIVDGGDGTCDEAKVGDDVQIIANAAAVPGGCGVVITAGPNGKLDTPVAGDDKASFCVVAGPNGNCDTPFNNQMTTAGGALGLTGLFFNNKSGVMIEADVEFNGATAWSINADGAVAPVRGATQTIDLQQVATHEFGHLIGIAHPFEADDQQVIPVGAAAAPNAIIVNPGPDGVLRTNPTPDDVQVGVNIREPAVGGNGIANTRRNNSPVNNGNPAPSDIMRPFISPTLACNHVLSADDQQACNFLYTWDLGDAPDPAEAGGAFNRYQTLIRSPNAGRTLSNVVLRIPGKGPAHLFGHQPDRYEWLGADEDGSFLETEALTTNNDEFDDGLSIAGNRLKIGDTTTVIIYVRTNNPGGRYAIGNPKKLLYFNGYFDFDTTKTFTSSDLEIWWQGIPGTTDAASPDFDAAASNLAANPMKLVFHVTVPLGTPVCTTWARMRLDYGEDEGRVDNINGDLAPAVGVAQFGEVEDYQVTMEQKIAQMQCPPGAVGDGTHPSNMQFCLVNTGNANREFNYSLGDQKNWIFSSDQPLFGTVTLVPFEHYCINIVIHYPGNCTQGEKDTLRFNAYPTDTCFSGDACVTTAECNSSTATLVGGFSGTADYTAVDLSYMILDAQGITGVNIYRAAEGSSEFVKVTREPIALRGVGTYQFRDEALQSGTSYQYALGLVQGDGSEVRAGLVVVRTLRAEFALGRPTPNPTRAGFTIQLSSPRDAHATLRIYDVGGRVVSTVFDGRLTAGMHTVSWDGRLAGGRQGGSGIYFAVYEAAGRKAIQRVVVMR